MEPEKRSFLTSLLGVIFTKMKWEEDTDVDELDDEDRGAFESLRKVCESQFWQQQNLALLKWQFCRTYVHSWTL